MKVDVTKFASLTRRLELSSPVEVMKTFAPEAGTVVAVEALSENPQYPDLELIDGTYSKVCVGDTLIGVLGSRQALRGFVGYAPYRAEAGETLHLLNMGGVIGRFVDGHPDLGEAIRVKLLGAVAKGRKPLHLRDVALPPVDILGATKPIVLVLGSCMNVGKTAASMELIRRLTESGLRVAAAKVSGVGALRDTRRMESAGAVKTATFADCGIPSTVDTEDLSGVAKTLAAHLSEGADVVVMEMGDGLLGYYHVDSVLQDRNFLGHVAAFVYAASDLVSAWGGLQLLAQRGIEVTALTGPVTDTVAGTQYVESALGVSAANAMIHGAKLRDLVAAKLPVPA